MRPAASVRAADADRGPQLGDEVTQRWRLGLTVTAEGGPCKSLYGTAPVPIEWPEQQVRIISEEVSPSVRELEYRLIGETVQQMVVFIPYLEANEEAQAVVTLEITRRDLRPPNDPARYVVAQRLDRDVRIYLGTSPGIESRHARIRALARELTRDQPTAWAQVEAIYDWVREHVEYENGPFTGALDALKTGRGDCEEISALFIAICRAAGIPARTVWVPDHCYPEFYLADETGQGHWFPCQSAGDRSFGGIPERRPILQKGDSFSVPERPKEKLRYVAEYLTGGGGKPRVRFIRELITE